MSCHLDVVSYQFIAASTQIPDSILLFPTIAVITFESDVFFRIVFLFSIPSIHNRNGVRDFFNFLLPFLLFQDFLLLFVSNFFFDLTLHTRIFTFQELLKCVRIDELLLANRKTDFNVVFFLLCNSSYTPRDMLNGTVHKVHIHRTPSLVILIIRTQIYKVVLHILQVITILKNVL